MVEKTAAWRAKRSASQQKYAAAMRAAGYVRRVLMVPPRGLDDYDAAVARLKRKWEKLDG